MLIQNLITNFKYSFLLWMSICYFIGISNTGADTKYNIEKHIGLYQLTDKKCTTLKNTYNPCKSSLFLEIVKGQFSGTKNTEIALVFWSGDITQTPELQYTAHRLKRYSKNHILDNKIWITKEQTIIEYLKLKDNTLSKYVLKIIGPNKTIVRNISYSLKPVRRGNLPKVRLNYPGNK